MPQKQPNVCVIIPAYRAATTIGRAVASALVQPEVAEVYVVDDASGDNTLDAAAAVDDGTGRLHLLKMERNGGPAAARNLALSKSRSEFIAVLDSDDFLLPNRFDRLFQEGDWDIVADDIAFVAEENGKWNTSEIPTGSPRTTLLTADEFIRRNRPKAGRPRAEYGFLKATIRRSFLHEHGLKYDDQLRLGEDYILYLRALALGARFKIVYSCGYVAIQRVLSLSGRFRTDDLLALAMAESQILGDGILSASAASLARRHYNEIMTRVRHRQFLDTKRQEGLPRAVANQTAIHLLGISRRILFDKLRLVDLVSRLRGPAVNTTGQVRMLLGSGE